LSAIVGLHLGAFAVVKIGLLPHLKLTEIEWPRLRFLPQPPKPVVVERPDDLDARRYEGEVQREPDIDFPVFDDADPGPLVDSGSEPTIVGGEPRLPSAPFQTPEIQTPDRRVKSLVDSCYPAASRRLLEEGRVVVRVVIGADGRATSWAVDHKSRFPRLDAATACVVRSLEFVAGRRNGHAVEATVQLPIVFRLD
jgi:protein TonB